MLSPAFQPPETTCPPPSPLDSGDTLHLVHIIPCLPTPDPGDTLHLVHIIPCLPTPDPGDTLHLVHIIPCLPAGDLATFFQPIDSDTGFLMEYPNPSLLGTKVPEEVVEREAQACKAEKV